MKGKGDDGRWTMEKAVAKPTVDHGKGDDAPRMMEMTKTEKPTMDKQKATMDDGRCKRRLPSILIILLIS